MLHMLLQAGNFLNTVRYVCSLIRPLDCYKIQNTGFHAVRTMTV